MRGPPMSVVDQIIDRAQFVEVIDGLEFKLRIITAESATRVIGNKTLGLAKDSSRSNEITDAETIRITKGYLELCMVSPKLGTESSPEADVVCFEDLGVFADKILLLVFKRSGFETLGNSRSSSEDTQAETSAKP
jgi:hypothetical protein